MSDSLSLKIATPMQPIPYGLGFYQTEEESLYVQLGGLFNSRRFFSFIDSPISRFDLDKQGRLIFFELAVPKRRWQVRHSLPVPNVAEPADIRWLNFRKRIKEPLLLTNPERSSLLIRLSDERPARNFYLAHSVILQVSHNNRATAILINEIVDDIAGLRIAAFRRQQDGKPPATSSQQSQSTITATS